MKTHRKKLTLAGPLFVATLFSFAVITLGNNGPAITDTGPFVLVAQNSIHLATDTQISSGDIASNKDIRISEDAIVNGNLFSDRIQLANGVLINGSATFNKLIKSETAEVFGEETKNISRNVVELPQIPDFQTGSINYIIQEDTTLNPGNYNEIEVKENAILTLNPGIYNINRLTLRNNSKLIYSGETTINIKNQLQIQNNTLIASSNPNSNSTTEFQINYIGKSPTNIGENSFITAKILAPDSRVQIGNKTVFRGQILAGDINVGEGSVLSREFSFVKESDLTKVVQGDDGARFLVNEITFALSETSTPQDAIELVEVIDGTIIGHIVTINRYKVEITTETIEELEEAIEKLEDLNDSRIESITKDYMMGLF